MTAAVIGLLSAFATPASAHTNTYHIVAQFEDGTYLGPHVFLPLFFEVSQNFRVLTVVDQNGGTLDHADPVWIVTDGNFVDYSTTYYIWNHPIEYGPIRSRGNKLLVGRYSQSHGDWLLLKRKLSSLASGMVGGWILGDWQNMDSVFNGGVFKAGDFTAEEVHDLYNYVQYGTIPDYAWADRSPVLSSKYNARTEQDCHDQYDRDAERCRRLVAAPARERALCWEAASEARADCIRQVARDRALKFWGGVALITAGVLTFGTGSAVGGGILILVLQ